jgi:hypothetical protein
MVRVVGLLLVLAGLCGCSGVDKQLAIQAKSHWAEIGKDYKAYIEADATLDASKKSAKVLSAEVFGQLLDEMAKEEK